MDTRITTIPTIAVQMETAAFRQGLTAGLTGVYAPDEPSRFIIDDPVTESDIVGIIQNLCEIAQEGWLSDRLLRHDAGLIAGWLLRPTATHH